VCFKVQLSSVILTSGGNRLLVNLTRGGARVNVDVRERLELRLVKLGARVLSPPSINSKPNGRSLKGAGRYKPWQHVGRCQVETGKDPR